MEEKLGCMDTRICASTADDFSVIFQDAGKCCLDNNLNTIVLGELLPSSVAGAVVSDMKKVAQGIFVKVAPIWGVAKGACPQFNFDLRFYFSTC